jgi:hypothetical protein
MHCGCAANSLICRVPRVCVGESGWRPVIVAGADAELGVRTRAQAGPAARVPIGVAAGYQQAQPAEIVQDRAQRRELAQAELARPAGRYLGYYRGAFGQHVREGGIGRQDGCRSADRRLHPRVDL